jgi:hypothetical protein
LLQLAATCGDGTKVLLPNLERRTQVLQSCDLVADDRDEFRPCA